MGIDKSSVWEENGNFEEIDETNDLEESVKVNPSQKQKVSILAESVDRNFNNEESEEFIKPPLFKRNLFLDDELLENYKSIDKDDKFSKLKVISNTSKKEDKNFVISAIVFCLIVVIISLIDTYIMKTFGLENIKVLFYVLRIIIASIISIAICNKIGIGENSKLKE